MYRYEVSKNDIKLVKASIKILEDLKAPISKKITFGYTGSKSLYGYCRNRGDRYYVMFHPDFVNNHYKINTIIHEILHTIDNGWDTPHRGEWARWAEIVSNSSPYKIKTHGEFHELKCDNINIPTNDIKKGTLIKKVYCPCCGKAYDIPLRGRDYWCPKCIKPLFKTLQNDELGRLSVKERQNEISTRISNLSIETAPKLLLYANKNNTEKIIINLMAQYPLNEDLKKLIEPHITTSVRHKLNKLCKNGVYNKFMTGVSMLINYELVTGADCPINILFENWEKS